MIKYSDTIWGHNLMNMPTGSTGRNGSEQENDIQILRELARKYVEICQQPDQQVKRELWRNHNSFQFSRPLIYVRAFAWEEMADSKLRCADPFWQKIEDFFCQAIFRNKFGDDFIFEPWITVPAVYGCEGWGVEYARHYSDSERGSFKADNPIKDLEDIEKIQIPRHEINEEKTAEVYGRVQEALGDLIPINLDRGPAYRMWTGDLACDLGYLRGIEHLMMDMVANPQWLKRLMEKLSQGVLKVHQEAEAAGDWSLSAHQNQAMPYARELADPAANVNGVARKELWYFMAAQELTCVSPQHHDEFMLQYQLPIMKEFGLTAYGCCEDLTRKIDILRQIPNLRRIAVSPFADAAKCAEQIGTDYVISYRPSPAEMVSYQFDPERVKAYLRKDFAGLKGTCFDITLKDVETVQGDPDRIRRWVSTVHEVIDEQYG